MSRATQTHQTASRPLETTTAQTACGEMVGRKKGATWLFAGIPYAQAPVGALRFKAPQPAQPFSEPFEAFKFGPAAPQTPSGGMTDAVAVRWSEDCLSLNVSTPACDDGKRAVLVWIHGGGYRTGQGAIPWYAGSSFNENGDIVVVSINYRLGALGFTDLSHLGEDYQTSSVNGILDQITALQWVQANIQAFGGSPERVTIAGESAGGFSVCTLLACDAAQGLFQRAIPQSGGAQHTLPSADARIVSQSFLEHLGVDDSIGLEAIDADAILVAQGRTAADFESSGGVNNGLTTTVAPFYPAHHTDLLPQPPLKALQQGMAAGVAVLTGSNGDETTLWGYGKVDEEKLQRIAQSLGAESVLPSYRELLPDASPEELLIALTTDHMFTIPALRVAEARAPHTADTWVYLFNWHSRAMQGRLKATHALEIPFAFNNLDKPGVDAFIGPGEKPQALADVMHAAWIKFINDGDPGWQRYDPETRATMVFDDTSSLANDPITARREAWIGLR